jgi:multiple sugar transport system permease protein
VSHIARVGRNNWRVRAGIAALYVVLTLGAITTVYPFLLMVSTAMKSHVDFNEYSPRAIVPRYLYSEPDLFKKYVEDRYANNLDEMNGAHYADYPKPQDVTPPANADDPATQKLAKDWEQFQKSLPLIYKKAGFGEHDNAPSRLLLLYREYLRRKFNDDIRALNEAWTEENISFDGVTPPFERTALRDWTPDLTNPKVADWQKFKESLPSHFLITATVDPLYQKWLKEDIYESDLAKLNGAWGTDYKAWSEITLRETVDRRTMASARDWETFVRTKLPLRYLSIAEQEGKVLPPLLSDSNNNNDRRQAGIVATNARLMKLHVMSPENLWRESVRRQGIANVEEIRPPQAIVDWNYVRANSTELRPEFAGRNFRTVYGYIVGHGPAVLNTLIFCALAILTAIIVNPMCAYALSRYPLPYAYQVLLFLLATMAFPAEVAMIPNFLLLKDLGMLNTFWALVLPGMANGFSIFLLKGFFDSLPKELYEAGIIDGASELTMFRRITVPLSLPIFSVIALNAFTASYGAFLFAMVVCQDPKMWTLMVWLYNLQDRAPQYVIFAALTLAALPTLLVFLAAQKVILRGIILPSFK